MDVKVTWPRLAVVLLLWAGATLYAQDVIRVDRVVASGQVDVAGGVVANGFQVVNTSGQLVSSRLSSTAVSQFTNDVPYLAPTSGLNATNLSTGTIPNARYAANVARTDTAQTWTAAQQLSSPTNFQDYIILGSTSATIAAAGATISPGTEAVVFVSASAAGQSIATISGAVAGRVLDVCNNGSFVFTLAAGGNIVNSSGNIGNGTCVQLIYQSTAWWYR